MTQAHPSSPAPKKKLYEHLYFQVLCGMLIGVLLGFFYPGAGSAMKPFGDAFIKLIRMVRISACVSGERGAIGGASGIAITCAGASGSFLAISSGNMCRSEA